MTLDHHTYAAEALTASAPAGNVFDAIMHAVLGVAIEYTLREAS